LCKNFICMAISFKKTLVSVFLLLSANEANAQFIRTIAGNGSAGFAGDGLPAITSVLNFPDATAVDASGNVYIADQANQRVRKINPAGIISTVAGTGFSGFSGDGGPATDAMLFDPNSVSVDAAGNVYIGDTYNFRIRKVNTSGIISTVAGNGTSGYTGFGIPATDAELALPFGTVVDVAGNIYIADEAAHGVRKVNTAGIITTITGLGYSGYSGDGGPASSATLAGPMSLALDGSGNLYIADPGNENIRKINTSGIISTVAGNGSYGFSGDGFPATDAELAGPYGVAVNAWGDLYIADHDNGRIRKVSTSGIITSYGGGGTTLGDGGPATAAIIVPWNVSVDLSGKVYVSEGDHYRVRRIDSIFPPCAGMPVPGVASSSSCAICGADSVTLVNSGASADSAGLTYQWQAAPDSVTWTNIAGATNLSWKYTPPGTLVYRCKVGCHITGDSAYSNMVNVYYESSCPCTAEYSASPDFSYLMSCFAMSAYGGTAVHDSITLFYGLYGDADRSCVVPTILLQRGGTYNDTVSTLGTSSVWNYQTAQVWIDFNDDGVFDTSEAVSAVYGCLGCCRLQPAISIPYTATTGVHRMRVRYAQSSTGIGFPPIMDPCSLFYSFEDYSYGNAFDYLTNIVPGPIPGITGLLGVCPGATTTLSCSDTGGTWSSGATGIATVSAGTGVVTGISAGTAVITYIAGTLTDTATITVYASPDPGIIAGMDSVCIGSTISLVETDTGGVWSSSNTGISTIDASGTVTGVTPGIDTISYTVISGDFGCRATAVFPFMVNPCTAGVKEINNAGTGIISIVPNPAHNTITISATEPITSLTITDLLGQVIYTNQYNTNKAQVDVSYLPPGVYFARINGSVVKKFVKE